MPFFTRQAMRVLEQNQLLISPVVLLELEYLYEIGRTKTSAEKIFNELEKSFGLKWLLNLYGIHGQGTNLTA